LDAGGTPVLAAVNALTDSVVVLRAGLREVESHAVGENPRQVVGGDFNGDSIPDLAAVNGGAGTISVLLGKGEGQFQPAVNIEAGKNPSAPVLDSTDGLDRGDTGFEDGPLLLAGSRVGTYRTGSWHCSCKPIAADFNRDEADPRLRGGCVPLHGRGCLSSLPSHSTRASARC
jgi:hypothetical protein